MCVKCMKTNLRPMGIEEIGPLVGQAMLGLLLLTGVCVVVGWLCCGCWNQKCNDADNDDDDDYDDYDADKWLNRQDGRPSAWRLNMPVRSDPCETPVAKSNDQFIDMAGRTVMANVRLMAIREAVLKMGPAPLDHSQTERDAYEHKMINLKNDFAAAEVEFANALAELRSSTTDAICEAKMQAARAELGMAHKHRP